jgi:hypothetical protein
LRVSQAFVLARIDSGELATTMQDGRACLSASAKELTAFALT